MNFQMTTEKMAKWHDRAAHLTTTDRYGRPFARLSELKPGSMVQVDEGFPFGGQSEIHPWAIVEVKSDDEGLYLDWISHCWSGEFHPDCRSHLEDQACFAYWPNEDTVDGGDNDSLIGVYHAGIPLSLDEQFARDNGANLFSPPYPKEVRLPIGEIRRAVALIDPKATFSTAENGAVNIQFSDGSDRWIGSPNSKGHYCLLYSNVR